VRKRLFFGVGGIAAVAALALAATGIATTGKSSVTPLPSSSCSPVQYGGKGSPQFLIASDLPLQGSGRTQTIEMTKAIAFELKQLGWKAGKYTIGYQSCDDSTAAAGKWDPAKCSANASNDARDKSVLGVIGTFNSGCAEIEVPIGNRAGLQWVSPANTYVGLTHVPALPGEPQKYYPTGKRTYARVVATDDFQGSADVLIMKQNKVKSLYVLNDKEAYGFGIASAVRNVAKHEKMKVAGFQAWDPKASSYQDIASKISSSGADAVFLGGLICENGGKLIKDLKAGAPKAVIYAPDGFSSFTDVASGAGSAADGMTVSIAGVPYKDLPAPAKKFAVTFGKSIGLTATKVNPYSNYAAAALQVMVSAIAQSGGTRQGVSKGVYGKSFPSTAIGPISLNNVGDPKAGTVSFYKIANGGGTFLKLITPPASLVALAKP
jgi:branched-chain amino acid transport system substrate-binding protein